MRPWRSAAATVLASVLLCCAAPVATEQAAVGATQDQAGRTLQPQETPEATVRELYADPAFFDLRNTVPPSTLQRFSGCFTPDLVRHFESYDADVDRWLEEHRNETLKLPVSEGPIFLSNYEGADTFSVGRASIDGSHADVPVSLSYTEGADTVRWVDIAKLRRVGGVWLLDDILFDPQRWDDYTLRDRTALEE
jgi:hypothetical protein